VVATASPRKIPGPPDQKGLYRSDAPLSSAGPLSSAHIRANCRNSSSSRVAASWNMAWNSVESICGTLRCTHCRLNRFGTSNMAMPQRYRVLHLHSTPTLTSKLADARPQTRLAIGIEYRVERLATSDPAAHPPTISQLMG
jgi:hypothetical protein